MVAAGKESRELYQTRRFNAAWTAATIAATMRSMWNLVNSLTLVVALALGGYPRSDAQPHGDQDSHVASDAACTSAIPATPIKSGCGSFAGVVMIVADAIGGAEDRNNALILPSTRQSLHSQHVLLRI
jgi:hypothetical protein